MSTALSRAREEAMKGGGDWLENDTLIANQLIFNISDVRDDRGGGFQGADRWVLRVEPYYEEDEDPVGLISLTDNPARRKFMDVIDRELEDLINKGEDPVIGPCVMVRLKGKNYRYIEIVDWNADEQKPILPQGAILAGARADEDMRPPRPREQRAQREQATREERRPFAEAAEAQREASPARPPTPTAPPTTASASAPSASAPASPESGASSAPQRRRRAATTEQSTPSTSSRTASTAPTESGFPTIMKWAAQQGLQASGRPSRELQQRYAAAKSAWEAGQNPASPVPPMDSASGAYQGTTEDVERELAQRAAESARTDFAEVPASAPNRRPNLARGEAPAAREIRFRAGMGGTTVEACDACGIKIHDRIFPTTESATGYALVHTRCDAGGEQKMMDAIPDPTPDPDE